uniref:uncharacterized protein n=1 Tax=Myxine glutinosa TaxID=7769 RepID=UPI0035902BFF
MKPHPSLFSAKKTNLETRTVGAPALGLCSRSKQGAGRRTRREKRSSKEESGLLLGEQCEGEAQVKKEERRGGLDEELIRRLERELNDPWYCKYIEVSIVILVLLTAIGTYVHFERVRFHITHGYAHLGYPSAQHLVGIHYREGVGVERDESLAHHWFGRAAAQGHARASYEIVIARLENSTDGTMDIDTERLLIHAAKEGLEEAASTLQHLCDNGRCHLGWEGPVPEDKVGT